MGLTQDIISEPYPGRTVTRRPVPLSKAPSLPDITAVADLAGEDKMSAAEVKHVVTVLGRDVGSCHLDAGSHFSGLGLLSETLKVQKIVVELEIARAR